MNVCYPVGPTDVPKDFTKPSPRYRNRAWVAALTLILFLAAYLGLAVWLGWTCFRLFAVLAEGGDSNLFLGLGAGFLSAFLLKALFFIRRSSPARGFEITPQDQPRVFAFIHALADAVGARRPRRVFVSPGVNACVFYDLSPLNLIVPSRKNLEIGLGLVNVLNVGEFKAVLAHEFGHFAQGAMAVGRWVYVSQQVAAHIIGKRDAFDRFLQGLSRTDIRIAWIGWLFRLIIWAIRSLAEVLFIAVLLAERALSREMEFQADLVSVSVTGSDALVSALHKLSGADDAWSRAVSFATAESRAGRRTDDVFRLQDRVLELMRGLLNDQTYGAAPSCAGGDSRVFKVSLAAPPQMWSTHPANSDREENAKRRYLYADIDQRSAWALFDDLPGVKAEATRRILGDGDGAPVAAEQLIERLDAQYKIGSLAPRYRGAYFARSTVRHARTVDELYAERSSNSATLLNVLYPARLSADVEERRALQEESTLLHGIADGFLKSAGNSLRYRGREVQRRELPALIDRVDKQLAELDGRIRGHDRVCRGVHVASASKVGAGWEGYLRGLLTVHHYASHAAAILADARAFYRQTVSRELSRRFSRKRAAGAILAAGKIAYAALVRAHGQAEAVKLDSTLLARLSINSWTERMQPLKLPEPSSENLAGWVKAFDSWIDLATSNLEALRFASFEQLIESEERVAKAAQDDVRLDDAPAPSAIEAEYPKLLPGEEISKPKRASWGARFLFGTNSLLYRAASVLIAVGIIAAVLVTASGAGHATIMVYNALGCPIHVSMNGKSVDVGAFGHGLVEVGDLHSLDVRTTTGDGRLIEKFDTAVSGLGVHEIYNVAGAGVLVRWTAVYGHAQKEPPQILGTPRWIEAHADVEFESPPSSISVSSGSGGGTRSVLTGLGEQAPKFVLGPIQSDSPEVSRIVHLHAQWDAVSTRYDDEWRLLAQQIDSGQMGK